MVVIKLAPMASICPIQPQPVPIAVWATVLSVQDHLNAVSVLMDSPWTTQSQMEVNVSNVLQVASSVIL
jgi:hypothetical protein